MSATTWEIPAAEVGTVGEKYIGYRPQKKYGHISPTQTTAKVNCRLRSYYLYITPNTY